MGIGRVISLVDRHEFNGVEGSNKQILRHLRTLVHDLLFFLSEIEIVCLLSLLLASDYTSFYEEGEGERALLQHSSCIGHLWYFFAVSIYATTARYSGTYTLPTSILVY